MKTTADEDQRAQPDSGSDVESSMPDPKDQSAELLRLTIPLLSRHGQSFKPVSYAVWYEYVRGENNDLREELDRAIDRAPKIDDQQTMDIYQRHVVGALEKSVYVGREGLLELLETVDSSVEGATASTSMFDTKLGDLATSMESDLDANAVRKHVTSFKEELKDVAASMQILHKKLEDSRTEVNRLTSELSQAREQAKLDALSGLLNRRGFDSALELSIANFMGKQSNANNSLAIAVFDIDHFKSINDTHGHLFGDKVIRAVARILDQGVMRKDHVGRLGGEEFAIILPETDLSGAMVVAERVRQLVSQTRIKNTSTDVVLGSITISGGVSIYQPGETADDFLHRADSALYQAKGSGRNKVCIEKK